VAVGRLIAGVWERHYLTPKRVLLLVLGASVFFRTFRLRIPHQAIMGDERFYIDAARIILGWHVAPGNPYAGMPAGIDPNPEHPPLGKLIFAGSMKVLGDDPLGWRLPSILAGIVSIVLVYLIVRAAASDEWLAVIAASIFAFDNLVFVQSRVGMLDMPMLVFLLLAVWLWMLRRPLLAGAACGVAALVKEPAVYGVLGLLALALGAVAWQWARTRTWNRPALLQALFLVGGFVAVSFFGLWILDLAVTPYNTPWAHLRAMEHYAFLLKRPGGPAGVESWPWQWASNQVQMPFYELDESLSVGGHEIGSRPVIRFVAAMNPIILGAGALAFAYVVWRAWRIRDRLSLWVVAWIGANYFLYFPLALISHRTMYIFYFLPTMPALAVATAQLLRQAALPRFVTWGYFAAVGLAFADYFPFRRVF
jgi:dolichyl-phosphate-mannose-protein mannosyltransferase